MYFENEVREWMMIVVCKERETIKNIKKNWYFNEMLRKIDNLICDVLKNEYLKLMLLNSFSSSQNGRNISYRNAIWNSNTIRSTLGLILISFGSFIKIEKLSSEIKIDIHFCLSWREWSI